MLYDVLCICQLVLAPDQMVGVEVFIVNVDGLHELILVKSKVAHPFKVFFADGAVHMIFKPSIYAVHMEDVIAAHHPTHALVCDWL